ncbi:MAG: hypothetical protein R3F44_06250 [Candidatus Competibacteraceae bacterium]
MIQQADIHSPALLIVGEVVKLHTQLMWFQPVPGVTCPVRR